MGQPVLIGHGICQVFYTIKMPNFFNLTWEKGVNRDIFGKLRMENVFLSYFEQIFIFNAIIYSNAVIS